jgi:hypothetical protein
VRQIHGNLEDRPYSLSVLFFLKRKRSALCNHCVVCFHCTAYFTFWANWCIFTKLSVNVMPLEDTLLLHFLGTFTKSWEVLISLIFPCILLSVQLYELSPNWMYLCEMCHWQIVLKSVKKIQIWWKLEKHIGT